MLRDRIQEAKKDNRLLTPQTGACRFCGQIRSAEVPIDFTDSDMDEYATECCTCEEATEYREELENKDNLHESVEVLFAGFCGEKQRKAIAAAGEAVCEDIVNKVQINVTETVRAIINKNSKGRVVVKREKKDKKDIEV